jgi:hypothetical protein
MKKIIMVIVSAIMAVTMIGSVTVNAQAKEAKNYTWYTTMADVVRELKALTPEAGGSVWYSDGHGMTVMYKYEYLDITTAELELAQAKVYDPEAYDAFMAFMAENGITLEAVCGWKLHELTWTTETIWEEVN